MQKNYTGLVLFQPKREVNYGSLLRTGHVIGGLDFIATIGRRYHPQASDTTRCTKTCLPEFHYNTWDDFNDSRPSCPLIGIELTDNAIMEHNFTHPRSAIYIVGSEDNGLPNYILDKCYAVLKLVGSQSMNVAVAGSIVLYNRHIQLRKTQ